MAYIMSGFTQIEILNSAGGVSSFDEKFRN